MIRSGTRNSSTWIIFSACCNLRTAFSPRAPTRTRSAWNRTFSPAAWPTRREWNISFARISAARRLPTDLVAMLCAWRAAKAGDLASCISLDETLEAMKTASELRDASRQMGRQTLRVANHFASHALACRIRPRLVAAERSPCHHRHRFRNDRSGDAIGLAWKWQAPICIRQARRWSARRLRLLPLGQLAGQRILWNVQPLIAQLAAEAQDKNRDDMWSFAPALEIAEHAATPRSKRGCSGRDFQAAQDWNRRARGIGQDGAGGIAVHAPEIELSTGGDHERYLHARRRGISHAARRTRSRPDSRR